MNKLYKTLIYDGQVSLSVLETTSLVSDAIKIHNLSDGAARTLGGLLTACAYMSGCLKSERGAVSLTVKAGDNGSAVSVSGDFSGHIRGYIDDGDGKIASGSLTVIKEDGFSRPFVGACELLSDDVAENLNEYFRMSEQIPTFVNVWTRVKRGVCEAAGGVVLQLLPGTSEENAKIAADKAVEMCGLSRRLATDGNVGADEIIDEYFSDVTKDGNVYLTFPEYRCNCSREKLEKTLLPTLGLDELLNIADEEGSVKIHCHYCNTDYEFTREEIEELFGK